MHKDLRSGCPLQHFPYQKDGICNRIKYLAEKCGYIPVPHMMESYKVLKNYVIGEHLMPGGNAHNKFFLDKKKEDI